MATPLQAYRATAAGDVSPIDDPGKGATATAAKVINILHNAGKLKNHGQGQ
jgi:hypothetical protein